MVRKAVAKITKYLGKMNKLHCCVVCILLGFILACLYLKLQKMNIEGMENQTVFVYCSMKGCPHCKAVDPKWDKFVKKHKHSYKGIKLLKKENKKHKDFMEKHEVKGYPTFVFIKKGKKTEKQCEERSEDGWTKFLDSMTGKKE